MPLLTSSADWPPVAAVILDMDGLLIDTEPAWRAAEVSVFAAFGVHLSAAELLATTGQAIGEVVAAWRQRQPSHSGEIDHLSDSEIADRITDLVVAWVKAEGQPMTGVTAAIAMFRRHRLGLAIASSSPMRLIDAVCERLGLAEIDVRCSAFDEANGKPAPDVYLTAARKLGAKPGAVPGGRGFPGRRARSEGRRDALPRRSGSATGRRSALPRGRLGPVLARPP